MTLPQRLKSVFAVLALVFSLCCGVAMGADVDSLLSCDTLEGWVAFADSCSLSLAEGYKGQALAVDCVLGPDREYTVALKEVDRRLPENYEISFFIKGQGPRNHFELKFFDQNGNVFWKKFEDAALPAQWRRIRLKQNELDFAWGPEPREPLRHLTKIEIGLSRTSGGTARFFVDEFAIRPLPADAGKPVFDASASTESEEYAAPNAVDGNPGTRWAGEATDPQWLVIDFGASLELVGFIIHWELAHAAAYEIEVSTDGAEWTSIFRTTSGDGGTDVVDCDPVSARYAKIVMNRRGTQYGYSIFEVIPRTTRAPWGVGQPGGFFLETRWDFAADPGNEYGTPPGDEHAWQKIRTHRSWEKQGYADYDGVGWYRARFFIPETWQGRRPFIRLTDIRDAFALFVNEMAVTNDVGAHRRIDVAVGDAVDYGAWNTVHLKVFNRVGDGGICGSVLLAGGERALRNGLQAWRRHDPKKYYDLLADIHLEGWYPFYLTGQQGYWTVAGVDGGLKESLLCEDGTLEIYKSFSLFPYLYFDGELVTRSQVDVQQDFAADQCPIPRVTWVHPRFTFSVTAFASGPPMMSSTYVRYSVQNTSDEDLSGRFFLALRPFQVNPPWQWGGLTRIHDLIFKNGQVRANEYTVAPLGGNPRFGATLPLEGGIMDFLRRGKLPGRQSLHDSDGLLSGAFAFPVELKAGEQADYAVTIPLYEESFFPGPGTGVTQALARLDDQQEKVAGSWRRRTERMPLQVPDRELQETLLASLAYIFVNRDGPALQPGSRAYEAAWMRDGALTCATLLRMGYDAEVRMFLDWYSGYIYEDGRVPAIVIISRNEVNPVHEYDSQGQFIYTLLQYYRYTGDRAYLAAMWPQVMKVLEYLEALRNSEVQDFYLQHDDQRRYYGILPKSVSHEGYYPEPGNHSYWDNFWALRGWKDARMIAEILEKEDVLEWIDREKAELHQAVYTSISNTMDYFNIDYLPGCAELGDFDPSSSAVAITACGELPFLPDDVVRATFERYWRDLNQRFDPGWTGSFSPYEVRIAQAFIMMGWRERANRLLAYLMSVRRPGGWRQWSEAVYVPPRTPGFIGDVPHGWVAAGLLNTVRTMLLYESDETLVVTAGVPPAWLADGRQVRIEEAPTYWGPLSYVLERTREGWRIELTGSAAPPDGFIVVNPLPGPITSATVNGEPATVHDRSRIAIKTLPAILEVEID